MSGTPLGLALGLLLAGGVAGNDVREDGVHMIPAEPVVSWARPVLSLLAPLIGGRTRWFAAAHVRVESVPSGAALSIYYLRDGHQLLYARATAPVRLRLPSRIDFGTKDRVRIRVTAEGYREREIGLDPGDIEERLVLQLDPLPSKLLALGLVHLGNRTTLRLRTSERADIHVRSRVGQISVELPSTESDLAEPDLAGGHVRGLELLALQGALLIRLETATDGVRIRTQRSIDRAHDEHIAEIELSSPGPRGRAIEDLALVFQSLPGRGGDPCAQLFEERMRSALGDASIARVLLSNGSVGRLTRPLYRQAMLRLGSLAGGRVRTGDGESLRTSDALELALALQSGAHVVGYLDLLDRFAETQPDPQTALRSLLAPELDRRSFARLLARAQGARRACAGR